MDFKTEDLVVDWVGFNLCGCDNYSSIASYLFELNFNIIEKLDHFTPATKILWDSNNSYKCVFIRTKNSYWNGFKLNFSGENAAYFYGLLQIKKCNLATVFNLEITNLARLDINYNRVLDKQSTEQFFKEVIEKLTFKDRNFSYSRRKNSKAHILRINKRKSSRFYRIYATKKHLRFEFEMKGITARYFQSELFLGHLIIFEENICEHFYKYSERLLPLNQYYTDWLLVNYRKNSKKISLEPTLTTTYLSLSKTSINNYVQRNNLWKFFQLLTFIHCLDPEKNIRKVRLSDQIYYEIHFLLKDFLRFTGVDPNQYQVKQSKAFFEIFLNIQKEQGIVNQFEKGYFRSFVAFPAFSIKKHSPKRGWYVSFSMAEDFFLYKYPFHFPMEFLSSQNKYDKQIKIHIVYAMSTRYSKKRFNIKDFLESFPVSNLRKTYIKKRIVHLFYLLQKDKYIQSKFLVTSKLREKSYYIELNITLLTKSDYFWFFEYERF